MHDHFGEPLRRWRQVEEEVRAVLEAFGYTEFRTPALERIEVFSHSVGEATDIVEKQMYTVLDRAEQPDREPETLVLRPEGTAPFVRALVEHRLTDPGHPLRYYYYLPMFRYERPQKGRLRQFHQFGAELVNDPSPEADAELVLLLAEIYRCFGISEYEIRVNSVGDAECRPPYKEKLVAYFRGHFGKLCPQCVARLERAPMRILDCKNEACRELARDAPMLLDHLSQASKSHHEAVKARLSEAGLKFIEDPHIVRGLDYYCKTAFEFTSPLLGAQSALGGGGRYDGLSERFGGRPFPAVGWALGMERLMLALEAMRPMVLPPDGPRVFLAPLGDEAFARLYPLALELRREGVRAEMSYDRSKGLKWLLKQADRLGARFALIVGSDELAAGTAILKDMKAGTQTTMPHAEALAKVKEAHDN